jgi:hypothetical protein
VASETTDARAATAGARAIAIDGEVKLGASGGTDSCVVRWHERIDDCCERSGLRSGQWQFAGSGQQHVIVVELVRNCEIGTVAVTATATNHVAIAAHGNR